MLLNHQAICNAKSPGGVVAPPGDVVAPPGDDLMAVCLVICSQ